MYKFCGDPYPRVRLVRPHSWPSLNVGEMTNHFGRSVPGSLGFSNERAGSVAQSISGRLQVKRGTSRALVIVHTQHLAGGTRASVLMEEKGRSGERRVRSHDHLDPLPTHPLGSFVLKVTDYPFIPVQRQIIDPAVPWTLARRLFVPRSKFIMTR